MLVCPKCGIAARGPAPAGMRPICRRDGTEMVPAERIDPRVDTVLGHYRLRTPIGQGGMGVVYHAEHVYIGKPVAVKVLHERFKHNDDAVQRFLREARAASLIEHPNIVQVHDFGEGPDGNVFFVMEYLEGEPLDALLRRECPLPLFRALGILNQIALALGAAHDKGIVHRDLKPENVFLEARRGRRELVRMLDEPGPGGPRFQVEPEREYDFVKVLDFGVAKIVAGEDLGGVGTVAGTIFGTPEYMPPEAARGEPVTPLVDIYAFGVLFYEMLTGRVPFEASSAVEVLSMQITDMPLPPSTLRPASDVTPQAEALILSCLEKPPERRPQSMQEVRERLADCYGSVRFMRDVDRIPGAEEAGLRPKARGGRKERLTDEIKDLLASGEIPVPARSSNITDELKTLFEEDPAKQDTIVNEQPVLLTNVKQVGEDVERAPAVKRRPDG